MEGAGRALAGLGKAERLAFDEWLDAVIGTLEDELLQPIYDQHPDLEPPAADWEEPTVISELVWADVRLPPSVTEQQLDAIILSILEPRWQKTAAVAILAHMECKRLGLPISGEVIAARLKVRSDSDRIEGIGDSRMWRHSEVRLKD